VLDRFDIFTKKLINFYLFFRKSCQRCGKITVSAFCFCFETTGLHYRANDQKSLLERVEHLALQPLTMLVFLKVGQQVILGAIRLFIELIH
jgi:hypothetical protein